MTFTPIPNRIEYFYAEKFIYSSKGSLEKHHREKTSTTSPGKTALQVAYEGIFLRRKVSLRAYVKLVASYSH